MRRAAPCNEEWGATWNGVPQEVIFCKLIGASKNEVPGGIVSRYDRFSVRNIARNFVPQGIIHS